MVDWGFARGEVSMDEIEVEVGLGWLIVIYISQENIDTKLQYKNRV